MSGNQTPAYVRTGTPIAAGPIIVAIASQFGLDLTVEQALMVVPVVSFLYYVLGRALETYNPKLGYVLGIAKAPAYSNEPAPSPGPGEEVVAEVVPEESPQPVDEPVEEPIYESDVAVEEEEPLPLLIRSTPLDEVRAAARKTPVKRAPRKAQPPS